MFLHSVIHTAGRGSEKDAIRRLFLDEAQFASDVWESEGGALGRKGRKRSPSMLTLEVAAALLERGFYSFLSTNRVRSGPARGGSLPPYVVLAHQ